MDNQQLNEYVKFIIDKSFDANKYFNDEAPWNKKDDKRTIKYNSLCFFRNNKKNFNFVIANNTLLSK